MIKGTENRNVGPLLIILRNKGTAERDMGEGGGGGKKLEGPQQQLKVKESRRKEEQALKRNNYEFGALLSLFVL